MWFLRSIASNAKFDIRIEGGDSDVATDTLNLSGAAGSVAVNLADSTLSPPTPPLPATAAR